MKTGSADRISKPYNAYCSVGNVGGRIRTRTDKNTEGGVGASGAWENAEERGFQNRPRSCRCRRCGHENGTEENTDTVHFLQVFILDTLLHVWTTVHHPKTSSIEPEERPVCLVVKGGDKKNFYHRNKAFNLLNHTPSCEVPERR